MSKHWNTGGKIMEFASLIAEFGARYGIGELSPDENGAVGFAVDGRQMIIQELSESKDVVTVSIELCDAAEKGSAIVNRLIMKANQALFLLDGMTLVLHAETGRYCLLSRFDVASLDFAGFDEKIGRILERADQWGQFLQRFMPVAADAEIAAGADGKTGEVPELNPPDSFLRV